jgi:hypothetical protein
MNNYVCDADQGEPFDGTINVTVFVVISLYRKT